MAFPYHIARHLMCPVGAQNADHSLYSDSNTCRVWVRILNQA
jgi:hypothetical protein